MIVAIIPAIMIIEIIVVINIFLKTGHLTKGPNAWNPGVQSLMNEQFPDRRIVEKNWKKNDSVLHSFVNSFLKFLKIGSKIYMFFYDFPETPLIRILHLEIESVQWLLVGTVVRVHYNN